MRKTFILLTFLCVSVMGWAESEYCDFAVVHNNDAAQQIGMTWTTLDNGDVQITISPKSGNTDVEFRNGGIEGAVSNIKVSTDNFATYVPVTDYFERAANPDGTTTYILHRVGNAVIPANMQIQTNNAIAWRGTPTTGDMWNTSHFTYTYGTICGSELQTPSITSISGGVITFASIEGATSYKAYIYQGSSYFTSIDVQSGELMSYVPYLAGTYQVRLRAFNGTQYSDFSDPYSWIIESNNPSGNLPPSSVNKRRIASGEGTDVYVSLETDLVTGNILGIISPINPADVDYVYWREDGIRVNGLRYNGEDFTDYFEAEYLQSRQIPHADESKITVVHFYPKTTGEHIPAYGGIISYSDGTLVWHYNNEGTYIGGVSFPDYIYGSGCGTLSRPIISSISSEGVIAFTAVPEATSYKAYVYNSEYEKVFEQTVVNGGTINYHPYLTDTYKVYLQALGADDAYSAYSAPLDWALEGNIAYLPQSAYCLTDVSGYANGNPVAFTWETVDGNIIITLSAASEPAAIEEGWHEDIQFRGGGMAVTNFKINGVSATDATFTKTVSGATLTLAPTANAVQAGDNITFEGTVEYRVAQKDDKSADTNDWPTLSFRYLYGTVCGENDHTNPVISTFTATPITTNSVTFHVEASDETDSGSEGTIAAYSLSGSNGFITTTVSPDGEGNFTVAGLTDNATYSFTLMVTDDRGNSVTSDAVVVTLPFNTDLNLALNKPCTGGYCQFNNSTEESRALEYKKANDGNTSVGYSAYGAPSADEAWWQVDLESVYDVNQIKVNWASDYSTGYAFYGSLDGTNWYLIAKDAVAEAGYKTTTVSAPARYIKVHSYNKKDVVFAEVEVYASGFSTLTDTKPVITYTALGEVTDVTAEIEIDAVDMTTKPITKYMVSGLGGDAVEVMASEGKITLTGLSQSTHYTASIQAKDESGNLSDVKQVEFTTVGSASGLYFFSDYFGWEPKVQDRARFSTTAVPGVLKLTIANMTAGNHNFKLYNADADRCTNAHCDGESDHHIYNATAEDVTIYATSEDQFITTLDQLYLRGTLVGEDQALEWNDTHTKATWRGALDLTGTKQFTVVKKNQVGETLHTYDRDFYAEAQTFDGDYTYGEFTLDVTKMTGSWDYVGLSFADDAESENSTVIATYADKQANVTLNRNILADGTWYTLCLPFDMSAEKVNEVFGASTIAELTSAEDRGSLIHLNFDYVHAIEAGKAYLIKPGHDFVAGTVIPNVQIKNADPIVSVAKDGEADLMHFQGTYNKTTLMGANIRFVAADNYLYSPNSAIGTPMGAFRCYFTIPTGSPASAPGKRARIVMGEQTATGVQNVQSNQVSYTKMLRDGQLLIIREGCMYNAQGMIVSE